MSGLDDEERGEPEGDEEVGPADEEGGEEEESFGEELEDEGSDGFDEGEDYESEEDLKVVDEALSHKDQNARALAIRRAIEERLEAKRLSQDLDYLDLDLDADD